MLRISKLLRPSENIQSLVRGVSTKVFQFPSAVEYSDKSLDKVHFHSIYGFKNLPSRTKMIIDKKSNEPVIENLEHMNHYKKLFQNFQEYLSSEKNITHKTFARILLNSIRLASLEKPMNPSIHQCDVLLKSILDQNFQIEFRKPFSNKEVEETTKSFIAQGEELGGVRELPKDVIINLVTEFSDFQSFHKFSESQIGAYYSRCFLKPLLYCLETSGNNLSMHIDAQQVVEVDWLLDQNIFSNAETNTIKNAIKPDYTIHLKSKEDKLLTYMPIELKKDIGKMTTKILAENLKQSIFQCLLSGSGVAILTDARNSLFYKISDFKTEGKKVKVLIDYSFVNSSQINVTESKMFIYLISHLKKHHDELVQTGTSTASNLCAEIIKHIKRSQEEQQAILKSSYREYVEYLKSQPQNKNLTIYKLVVPKDATIKDQSSITESQQFEISSEVLKKSTLFKGNDINPSTLLVNNSNDVCITMYDEILSNTYGVEDANDIEMRELSEQLELLSIIQKREKFGFNNPYLAYGLIEIVRDDDEMVGYGQGFVTIESKNKEHPNLEELQAEIEEQISLFKQAGIELRHPLEYNISISNGTLYLKALNMSPVLAAEKTGTPP